MPYGSLNGCFSVKRPEDTAWEAARAVHLTVRRMGRKEQVGMSGNSNCDCCVYYIYDEDYDCFYCDVNLDEDEMGRFMTGTFQNCPYFRLDDEYRVVRHQM